MSAIQKFKSDGNKKLLIKIIDDLIRTKFQVRLHDEFHIIFNNIVDSVSTDTIKPPNTNDTEYLKYMNKKCIDAAHGYISNNIIYFPKIKNPDIRMSANAADPPLFTPPVANSYSPTQTQPQNGPLPYPTQSSSDPNNINQNLFKGTDDLLKQMQYDRNNFGTAHVNNPFGYANNANPNPNMNTDNNRANFASAPDNGRPNFASPADVPGQMPADQALAAVMNQRKQDFPSMVNPTYVIPGQEKSMINNGNNIGNTGTPLMNIILQTPVAIQNPNMVPSIINEIHQMGHLMDLMNKDPGSFQRQITNPEFMGMIINQIKNKANDKMKPMSLNDIQSATMENKDIQPINVDLSSELTKRMNIYQNGGTVPDLSQNEFVNQLNKHIPPSDYLINNTLPDLDAVHLIDYDLFLDFRTDLENDTKNRYSMKFNKYGNVSKVKLNSCLIPVNDYLLSEPYIYIKIEELGGRCYTSNHDNVFGKLILSENRNGYLYYKPDEESCIQLFSQPMTFNKFTISFLNYMGKYLNLKEIIVKNTVKLKKLNRLKFVTQYKHQLVPAENIEIQIIRKHEIDSYNVPVFSIIDDYTFTVDNVFDVLTNDIKIMKNSVNCSLSFKLFEINWNLLINKTPQNAQLIKLSQLVTEKRKNKNQHTEIIDHVKTKLASQPTLPTTGLSPSQPPINIATPTHLNTMMPMLNGANNNYMTNSSNNYIPNASMAYTPYK